MDLKKMVGAITLVLSAALLVALSSHRGVATPNISTLDSKSLHSVFDGLPSVPGVMTGKSAPCAKTDPVTPLVGQKISNTFSVPGFDCNPDSCGTIHHATIYDCPEQCTDLCGDNECPEYGDAPICYVTCACTSGYSCHHYGQCFDLPGCQL